MSLDEALAALPTLNDAQLGQLAELLGERLDGWSNVLTSLNQPGRDPRTATRFKTRDKKIECGEIESMYRQDAIFARIVDAPAEHSVRRWIKIEVPQEGGGIDETSGRDMLEALKVLGAREAFYELMRLDRLDGGAAMILGVDDGREPSKPLNLEAVKSVDFLNVVSKREIFPGPRNPDMMSGNFRKPDYFTAQPIISGDLPDGRIHHSRVIQLTGIRTNERTDIYGDGWGDPVIERVYEPLRQYGTLYDYVEALFKDLVQAVMTIKGLNQLIEHDENGTVLKRLQLVALCSSAFNAIIKDDGEDYERRTLQLSGIPEIIIKSMDRLAAAAEMPLSILFAQPPTGLTTDDKSGRTTFYDGISNKWEKKIRRPLEYIVDLLFRSKTGPTEGKVPESYTVDPIPLTQPTEQETSETRLKDAQTDQTLIQNQVISPEEARTRLINDPSSPYNLDIEQEGDEEGDEEVLDLDDPDLEATKLDLARTRE